MFVRGRRKIRCVVVNLWSEEKLFVVVCSFATTHWKIFFDDPAGMPLKKVIFKCFLYIQWENCISLSVKNRFGVKMHRIGHEEHEKNVFESSFAWKKFFLIDFCGGKKVEVCV